MLGLIMFGIAIPLTLIFSYFWAVIIYRLFGGLFAGKFLPAIIMGLIGLVLCIFGSRKLWFPKWQERQAKAKALPSVKPATLSETSEGNTVSDFAQESYEKAVADYNSLNEIIRQLSDKELIGQLEKMPYFCSL